MVIKRYAVVSDNIIKNVILADKEFADQFGYIEIPDYVGVGWEIINDQYIEPGLPASPEVISMRQARLILFKNNLLHLVDNLIQALPDGVKEEAFIEWEYATEVRRDSNLVLILGNMLNLSDNDINNMFIAAADL